MSYLNILNSTGKIADQYLPSSSSSLGYGLFARTTNKEVDQTLSQAVSVEYDTAGIGVSNGCSATDSSSVITFTKGGVWKIDLRAIIDATGNVNANMDLWLVKNGTAIPNSNTKVWITHNQSSMLSTTYIGQFNVNDTLQVYIYSNDIKGLLKAYPINQGNLGDVVIAPSLVVALTQLS